MPGRNHASYQNLNQLKFLPCKRDRYTNRLADRDRLAADCPDKFLIRYLFPHPDMGFHVPISLN